MIQHTRNIIQGSWRSCDNVPGASCKLLTEDFTTYQEHVASHLKKMLQRIRNILQVTWRMFTTYQEGRASYLQVGRCCKCQERLACYLTKMLQHSRSIEVPEEVVTTCHERLASYLQKISQRIRNVLQVTWRRCYNVSGTSGKLLEEKFTTYQEGPASYLQVGRCCT